MDFSLLLPGLLVVLSLLNVIIPPTYLLWKASVATKEYGHWAALFCFGLVFVFLARGEWAAAALAAIALSLFALPVIHVVREHEEWSEELRARLGVREDAPSLFSWKILWFGRGLQRRNFERISYDPAHPDLHIDLYRSANPGASPWVVVIFGGGWNAGDSEQLPELNWLLSQRGISVAAVTYRYAPKYQWPRQKLDVVSAIEYLKSHADQFGLDPHNYFLLGRSAGGQLAGVIAYTMNDPGLRGYIGFYPPTDLFFGYEAGEEDDLLASRQLVRNYMGGTPFEKPDVYADASVLEALNHHPVPTLLFHGRPDRLTWFKHSERLALRLQTRGIPYAFILLPWAAHGFDYTLNGPGGQVSTAATEYFIRERFSPGPPPRE